MEKVFPLEIPTVDGVKRFASKADFDTWLEETPKEYDWLPEKAEPADAMRNQLNKFFNAAKMHIDQAIADEELGADPSPQLNPGKDVLRRIIGGDLNFFDKGTPRLEYCKRLAKTDPLLASYVLWTMLRPTAKPLADQVLQMRGQVGAMLYEFGIIDNDRDFVKASDSVIEDAKSALDDIQATRERSDRKLKIFEERATKRRANHRTEFRELIDKTKEEWADLKNVYDEKLALNSSVQYWDKKSNQYKNAAWLFWVGFGVIASIAALLIGLWGVHLFEQIAAGATTRWWQISIVAVYATIIIMVLRMLSKSAMANMHLKVDAEHRVTMITTYLALLREGRALEHADRKLIVEALFRPAHSGLIANETSGNSVVEQLAALLTRRSS